MLHGHVVFATTFLMFCTVFTTSITATGLGGCPNVVGMKNFNITKFSGHWYEIERSFHLMELVKSCVSLDLSVSDRGRLQIAVNTKSTWTGSFSVSEGVAIPLKKDPTQFLYKVADCPLPKFLNRYLPGAGPYQVLATDYSKYAIVYSCTDYFIIHSDLIWIWSRQKEIDAHLRSRLYTVLRLNDLDSDRLVLSQNINCTE